jgi:hypothetical protein
MKHAWNRLLETLLWIRFGQELGTDSDLAQNIAAGIDAAVHLVARIFG